MSDIRGISAIVQCAKRNIVLLVLGVLLALFSSGVFAQEDLTSRIFSLAWSPDGTRIASGHREGRIKIWDATTGTLLTTFQSPDPFNPGRFLEIMDQLEWSPDSTRIAIGEMSALPIGFLHVMDAATGIIISSTQTQDSAADLSWSPDGTRIAVSAQSFSQLNYRDAWLIVDAGTGAQLLRVDPPELQVIGSLDWSPDGSRIATGGSLNNLVQIWDTNSGALLTTFQGHTENVGEVRWNSSGTRLATLGGDFTLRIWDASTGQNLQNFLVPFPTPDQIAWQPNSDQLALVFDTSIQIIDTDTGQTVSMLPGGGVAAWSPDGTQLAINYGSVFCIMDVTEVSVTAVPRTMGNPAATPVPVGLCSS